MIDLHVLKELSVKLNSQNITWGIGGSCLLMLYNLYAKPNDLDLWVLPEDMDNVRTLFADYEEISTDIRLPKEFHYKIYYNNVEVDFVACFIIKPNQHQFKYFIPQENIRKLKVGNIQIPCTYLEDWYIIYRLLKKDDKAALIQQYFKQQQVQFDEEAIKRALQNKDAFLPVRIKNDVYNLIFDATQLSLQLDG